MRIRRGGATPIEDLQTNHEEADTRVCFLLHHALRSNDGGVTKCVLRSSSGDIDIPIILLANEVSNLTIYIDSGTGKSRKIVELASCDLSSLEKAALLGLHSYSGNDYVSSFFRKGKKACWKLAKSTPEFLSTFAELGLSADAPENVVASLTKFTCHLYGEKQHTSIDDARRGIFWRTFARDEKVIDLSLLPPCMSSLAKHIKRANFVARIWRQASTPIMQQDDHQLHGWNEDLSVDWILEAYPEDISDLLVSSEDDPTILDTISDEISDDDNDD